MVRVPLLGEMLLGADSLNNPRFNLLSTHVPAGTFEGTFLVQHEFPRVGTIRVVVVLQGQAKDDAIKVSR